MAERVPRTARSFAQETRPIRLGVLPNLGDHCPYAHAQPDAYLDLHSIAGSAQF